MMDLLLPEFKLENEGNFYRIFTDVETSTSMEPLCSFFDLYNSFHSFPSFQIIDYTIWIKCENKQHVFKRNTYYTIDGDGMGKLFIHSNSSFGELLDNISFYFEGNDDKFIDILFFDVLMYSKQLKRV